MAEQRAEDLWRRAYDANLGYSRAVGTLTTEYVRALASVARDLLPGAGDTGGAAPAPQAPAAESPVLPSPQPPTMVLEAEAGDVAVGAFVVENSLSRSIATVVVASPFARPDGDAVVIPIACDPPEVKLDPGQQVVVRVAVTVTDELDAGTDYAGEFAVPELPGTRIPVVLRRRARAGTRAKRASASKRRR